MHISPGSVHALVTTSEVEAAQEDSKVINVLLNNPSNFFFFQLCKTYSK